MVCLHIIHRRHKTDKKNAKESPKRIDREEMRSKSNRGNRRSDWSGASRKKFFFSWCKADHGCAATAVIWIHAESHYAWRRLALLQTHGSLAAWTAHNIETGNFWICRGRGLDLHWGHGRRNWLKGRNSRSCLDGEQMREDSRGRSSCSYKECVWECVWIETVQSKNFHVI